MSADADALYAAVLARYGGHCGCFHGEPGACPRNHPVSGRRCYHGVNGPVRLLVVPIDPTTPLHIAAGLGVGDLIALCTACAASRATAAANAADAARAEALAANQISLFDAA